MKTKIAGKWHEIYVEKGELRSYTVDGYEFIHQRQVGWPHSDTEMFPIIGPTALADYKVKVDDQVAVLDQHGLLREFSYETLIETSQTLEYYKEYKAFTEYTQSKYPENSPSTIQFWPYDFRFFKRFEWDHLGLKIRFEIQADTHMPFMLGYHPAFKTTEDSYLRTTHGKVSHQDIAEAGSKAYPLLNMEKLTLVGEQSIEIISSGFGHFMCWTEVPQMLCIEPISYYPNDSPQHELHRGFSRMNAPSRCFEVLLHPMS